ncbi:MAG: hypothetical protein AAFR45_08065 [Pseudomonadota bacterium]
MTGQTSQAKNKPEADRVIDRKNLFQSVVTIVSMSVACAGAYYTQSVKIETLRGEVRVLETRLDSFDTDVKRRLANIETKLDRVLFGLRGDGG